MPTTGKTCTKCLVWKEASLFARMNRNKSGLQPVCKACKKIYRTINRERILSTQKAYRENHREQIVAGIKDWESRNRDRVRARGRKYDLTHREVRREQLKKRRESNPQLFREKVAAYLAKNKDRFAAIFRYHTAMRRKLIRQQKISKTYAAEISAFYKKAPSGYHIDHIIPLKGKNVCGLHVPWNLQYLTAAENQRKGNRYADS